MSSIQYAHNNHQRIYFESHGQGRPLLFIMGIGYDASLWHLNQVAFFKEHFQTIVLDNRDSGRSDAANGPYSIHDMSEDVIAVLDELKLDKANIVGLSMGGMIAQDLAISHPQRVDHLILSGTSAAPERATFDPISLWNFVKQHDKQGMNFAAQQVIWLFSDAFNRNHDAVKQTLELLGSNPNPVSAEGYARLAEAYVHFDSLDSLHTITAPTMVLSGSRDRLTPPWLCREVADAIPSARFELIDDEQASHVLPLEMPERFNQLVLDFLH